MVGRGFTTHTDVTQFLTNNGKKLLMCINKVFKCVYQARSIALIRATFLLINPLILSYRGACIHETNGWDAMDVMDGYDSSPFYPLFFPFMCNPMNNYILCPTNLHLSVYVDNH